MDPQSLNEWVMLLQSPMAVTLVVIAGFIYTDRRNREREKESKQREEKHAQERASWIEQATKMASALDEIKDHLRREHQ